MANPIVFFDIQIGKTKIGRVKFQLLIQYLPKTCENFRQLCTGEYLKNKKPTGYKQTCLFKVSQTYIRGGDYNLNNGQGGQSAYSEDFIEKSSLDEEKVIKYQKQFKNKNWVLSMVKNGNKKVDSIFQINSSNDIKEDQLIVFGYAIQESSYQTLRSVSMSVTNQDNKPKTPIVIKQCGQL